MKRKEKNSTYLYIIITCLKAQMMCPNAKVQSKKHGLFFISLFWREKVQCIYMFEQFFHTLSKMVHCVVLNASFQLSKDSFHGLSF